MGYYSDVGLCLTAQGREALSAALCEAEKNNPNFTDINTLLDRAEVRTDTTSGTVAYLWESTKWYEDFPEVRFIENLLQELDSAEFLLIRVGEESEDTEIQGTFWGNPLGMCITRGIAFAV